MSHRTCPPLCACLGFMLSRCRAEWGGGIYRLPGCRILLPEKDEKILLLVVIGDSVSFHDRQRIFQPIWSALFSTEKKYHHRDPVLSLSNEIQDVPRVAVPAVHEMPGTERRWIQIWIGSERWVGFGCGTPRWWWWCSLEISQCQLWQPFSPKQPLVFLTCWLAGCSCHWLALFRCYCSWYCQYARRVHRGATPAPLISDANTIIC